MKIVQGSACAFCVAAGATVKVLRPFLSASECVILVAFAPARFQKRMTEALMAKLPDVSDETLAAPSPLPIPGDNPTVKDLVAFLTMHETYHIGQMGLLRKSMTGTRIMDT